ncbi:MULTISPECIES: glycosyltransferase [Rhodococcus]|uniref:glycosyltransferase n=1 Tax=Nocardiaceae TaxID=85025 RepID=UPI0009FCF2B5|nr:MULTISPECIES: glycosyltransferase [Rhodococcus]NIL75772.1 hypothetical protein [Rhodococcus sp. B10]
MSRSVSIIGTRGYPSYYGGFETLVRKLAPYLVNDGWDVTVYGRHGATRPDDVEVDDRVRSLMTRGVESRSLSTLSYGLSSTAAAARQKPDVALIMNVANGYWLPLLRSRRIPSVLNVDGIEWERQKWGRNAKAVFRGGASLTARFADHLVYDSIELGKRWERDFGRTGFFIPYGGTDPGDLDPVFKPSTGSYALMVARFVPENTVSEFLDAAESITQKCDVVIVGSSGYGGEFDVRVEAMASRNDRIHWYGHVSDDQKLFSLWQNANAYFHGHSVGGTNPALVQAMTCGAPIVARDTVFNREVLGSCAVFVEPTAASIADGVISVIEDRALQSSLGAAGYQRALDSYTWDSVCRSYADALAFAADSRRGTAIAERARR